MTVSSSATAQILGPVLEYSAPIGYQNEVGGRNTLPCIAPVMDQGYNAIVGCYMETEFSIWGHGCSVELFKNRDPLDRTWYLFT